VNQSQFESSFLYVVIISEHTNTTCFTDCSDISYSFTCRSCYHSKGQLTVEGITDFNNQLSWSTNKVQYTSVIMLVYNIRWRWKWRVSYWCLAISFSPVFLSYSKKVTFILIKTIEPQVKALRIFSTISWILKIQDVNHWNWNKYSVYCSEFWHHVGNLWWRWRHMEPQDHPCCFAY